TKVIGWGTLLLIVLTGYLIYLEYNPPYSKAMDEPGKIRFQKVIDSIAHVSNDSARKADSIGLSKKVKATRSPL
ncbi:MAG: hypothetical protein Q8938_00645, partial [Bacteroidota bacterium]|nr:hypothetical protein [Bacteroidota bacterium]